MQTDLLTTTLDLLGVFANRLLGGAVARARNMDLFGFAAMGLVSGLGGGIIRDVLLEHGTPAALVDPAYIPTALVGAAIAFPAVAIGVGFALSSGSSPTGAAGGCPPASTCNRSRSCSASPSLGHPIPRPDHDGRQ